MTRAILAPLRLAESRLELLDQRLLPAEERWLAFDSAAGVAGAIGDMVIRGAPAIGIAAAWGVALEARRVAARGGDPAGELGPAFEILAASRPTAVNLFWALDRMRGRLEELADHPPGEVAESLAAEAQAIWDEDVAACRAMGRLGAALLPERATILTHCNAGALATGGFGTALGVIRAAVEAGKTIRVVAGETRPYLQGARLTAWELQRDNIDVTLITDNAAGWLMARGEIDAVVTGADRIAANGDAANKIGTYTLALLAARHGLPFYIAAPRSTFDPQLAGGGAIPIEERSAQEVTEIAGTPIAPAGVPARHPAFDVTPAQLITALITERAVLRPPYGPAIAGLLARE